MTHRSAIVQTTSLPGKRRFEALELVMDTEHPHASRLFVVKAVCFFLLTAIGTAAQAELVSINFEQFSASSTELYTRLDFVQDGVEISIYRPDNISFRLSKVNYFPFGEVSLSPFNGTGGAAVNSPFILEVSVPVRSIIVSMGDWGEDADTLTLVGFEGPGLTGGSASSEGSLPTGPNNVFTSADLLLRSPSHMNYFRSFTIQGGGASFLKDRGNNKC